MSNGVLCFANNNSKINYILQAQELAKRVRKYLNLPTSIVTTTPEVVNKEYFDEIINISADTTNFKRYYNGISNHVSLQFNNHNRINSYDITPYDKTLVLDTDVIVCNDDWKHAFNNTHPFQIYKHCIDLNHTRKHNEFEYINDKGIDFYWATAFCFGKNNETKLFFDLLKIIKKNYYHYNLVFDTGSRNFRNDHIFSMGIHIMNGFANKDWTKPLPGRLYYSLDRDILQKIDNDSVQILLQKPEVHGEYILSKTKGMNVHVMNKFSLEEILNV